MQKPKLILDLGMTTATSTGTYKVRKGRYSCTLCDTEFIANTYDVNAGKIVSCGCYRREQVLKSVTTHGLRYHPLYMRWKAMRNRCLNPNDQSYKYYGGRGLTMDKAWAEDPAVFFSWSENNGYRKELSIDRIDNDKGYSPENCRWTTRNVQSQNIVVLRSNNKSGYKGVSWSKRMNKWKTQIAVSRKTILLGYYIEPLEAAMAYDSYVLDNNLNHTINGVKNA